MAGLIKYTGVTPDWRSSVHSLSPPSTFAFGYMISFCHTEPCQHANETQTLWFGLKKGNFKYTSMTKSYGPVCCVY